MTSTQTSSVTPQTFRISVVGSWQHGSIYAITSWGGIYQHTGAVVSSAQTSRQACANDAAARGIAITD